LHTLALILGALDLCRHPYFGEQNGRAPIRDGIAATSNAKGNSMRGISRYVTRNSNGKPPRVFNKLPKECDRYIQWAKIWTQSKSIIYRRYMITKH
jgi:hypothetical protein